MKIEMAAKVYIENDKGEILLIKRGKNPDRGTWDSPGGGMEAGETLDECGIREVKEEANLDVEIESFIGADEVIDDEHGRAVIIYLRGRLLGGELKAGDDAEEAKWIPKSELDSLTNLRPLFRKVVLKK